MQQVTPTTKWQRNTLPIPVGNNPPVRLPLNKPAVLSIDDQAAAYLVQEGYAVYCNHLGQPLEKSEPAVTPPEEPVPLEGGEVIPAEKSEPAVTPPEEESVEEKALEFLRKNPPEEVAVLIRGIDQEKAEELATEEELTWEKVSDLLTKRQVNALKRYVKQND